MKFEVGNPVKLMNATGYEAFEDLNEGTLGVINSVMMVPESPDSTELVELVYFMPHNKLKSYVMPAHRVEHLDEEEAEALETWELPELEA